MNATLTINNSSARRLFLYLQGLADDPRPRMRRDELFSLIERMGFVQLDSIITVERAHHLTLFSRNQTYRRRDLDDLLAKDRRLFEHWTHDSSIIPIQWFPHWTHRFRRMTERVTDKSWFIERIGDDAHAVIARVHDHIRDHGPTMSRDIGGDDKRAGPWWGWGPTKAALEYLWWAGELSVVRRENFQKVYDLTERVIPDNHRCNLPSYEEHVEWACSTALDRLGIATSGELAAYWASVSPADAKAWVEANANRLRQVLVASSDGSKPRASIAWNHLEDILANAPEPPAHLRFLSPFDPVLRDRNRALRLFNFDYRFEAFVPAPKRRYGYYVLPLLEGERIAARACMKFHRDRGELTINNLWWEPKVRQSRGLTAALASELERFRRFLGADRVTLPANRPDLEI